jgi:hypothetical protein
MSYLRIKPRADAQAPTVTVDPKPRHCANSKTWKTVHAASKFAGKGRNTHAPWTARENSHATNPDSRAVFERRS